jgi:hypothetical protein
MLKQPAYMMLLLAASVGVPYLSTQWETLAKHLPDAPATLADADKKQPLGKADEHAEPATDPTASDAEPAPVPIVQPEKSVRQPPMDLNQVFDFGVTPAWVLGNWPRVSTKLADIEQLGYRVPLVSGTRSDDLAGSLTYQFNTAHELQRISFQGSTADGRRLIALLERKFGFKRQLTTDPNLYLYQVLWSGKPKGQCWFHPSDVVVADQRYSSFHVRLTIDRPSDYSAHAPAKAAGAKTGWNSLGF